VHVRGSASDSPGAPPSATAHELFRGFSYIAPLMLNELHSSAAAAKQPTTTRLIASVSRTALLHAACIRSMELAFGADIILHCFEYFFVNFLNYTTMVESE